eukprot:5003681-Prymnesium_polylepis.1
MGCTAGSGLPAPTRKGGDSTIGVPSSWLPRLRSSKGDRLTAAAVKVAKDFASTFKPGQTRGKVRA